MEELSGTLTRQELGGAATWTLTPDEGEPVQLTGQIDSSLAGRRVTATVREAEQGFGFSMVGPIYQVLEIRPA